MFCSVSVQCMWMFEMILGINVQKVIKQIKGKVLK